MATGDVEIGDLEGEGFGVEVGSVGQNDDGALGIEQTDHIVKVGDTAAPVRDIAQIATECEQLGALGFLRQTDDAYPILVLTEKGLALLKDEASHPTLTMARQRPARKDKPRAQSRVEAESWQDVDRDLFDRLRAVRLEIARSRGVPPYVIFHDATLREMARLRPASIDALLTVKGVGARKADDLGETFLAAIRGHAS